MEMEDIEKLWSTQSGQDKRLAELEKTVGILKGNYNIQEGDLFKMSLLFQGLIAYLDLVWHEQFVDDEEYIEPHRRQRKIYTFTKKIS